MGGEQGPVYFGGPIVSPSAIIVDANLAFKALVTNRGDLRERLGAAREFELFSPRFLFVELFKHRQRLAHATGLSGDDLVASLHTLVARLEFVNEANIPLGIWMEAHRLCREVDERDTAYVALTLHIGGRLWTEDRILKEGLRARGFNQFFEP